MSPLGTQGEGLSDPTNPFFQGTLLSLFMSLFHEDLVHLLPLVAESLDIELKFLNLFESVLTLKYL